MLLSCLDFLDYKIRRHSLFKQPDVDNVESVMWRRLQTWTRTQETIQQKEPEYLMILKTLF